MLAMSGLCRWLNSRISCWSGRAFGRPPELKEIGMAAKGFKRPAALFAGVSLAAMVAAFAIGHARAQTVIPPPPPPPPVFNPSSPSTLPQAPEVPVSPTLPSGPSGFAPEPASPAIEPPPVSPAIEPPPVSPPVAPAPVSPAIEPPPPVTPQTANTPVAAKAAPSQTHAAHHRGVRHRWSKRRARFYAPRVLGPSYYPGLGEFYPPYADPCHFSRVWHGYFVGYWAYSCAW
jgi:hypothetical protein